MAADDPSNHNKFAGSEVVRRIDLRLASGQPLNDAKSNMGESVGILAVNAADAMGRAKAAVVATPINSDEFGDGRATAAAQPRPLAPRSIC